MLRNAVALRVNTVVVCCCCFIFVYEGCDGVGLCSRFVSHRCNEATADARLVFIVDKGLGIDPAVEFGGVAVPFHQSLCSSAHLAALQYRFHAVRFIGGDRHLLQLRFVEGSVQHSTEIADQSIDGLVGGMNHVYGEHIFTPIRHIAFFEQYLNLAYAHAIQHTKLGRALTVVTVQTLPHLFLICRTHL